MCIAIPSTMKKINFEFSMQMSEVQGRHQQLDANSATYTIQVCCLDFEVINERNQGTHQPVLLTVCAQIAQSKI